MTKNLEQINVGKMEKIDDNYNESIWDKLESVKEIAANNFKQILNSDLSVEENKKKYTEIINKAKFEEIIVFLQTLEDYPNKHSLPQWIFDVLLEKFFVGWEDFPERKEGYGDADDIITFAVTAANNLHNYKPSKNEQETTLDKFFKSFVVNLEKHPSAGLDYWSVFKHSSDDVRPDILISGMTEIVDSDDINIFIKGEILQEFGEIYSRPVRRQKINSGINTTLDFENHQNYKKTLKVIQFLDNFFQQAEYMPGHMREYDTHVFVSEISQPEEVAKEVKKIIQTKIDQKTGSFILNLHAKKMLDNMNEWEDSSESQKNLKIFEKHNQHSFSIAPGIVGYYADDNLYIGNEKDEDLRPVSLSDLQLIKNDKRNNNIFLNDFIFLNSPSVREIIKKEIGVNLSLLTLPEQANFLQFLYTKTENQVEELKQFLNQTNSEADRKNRIKSFLSLESGELSGESILNIGQQLEDQPEVADELFGEYARVVDETEKISEEAVNIYNEMFPEEKLDKNKISQLIIEKANQLLVDANHKLSTKTKTEEKQEIIKELISLLKRDLLIWQETLTTFRNLKQDLDDKQLELFDFAMEKFATFYFETIGEEELYDEYIIARGKKIFLAFTHDLFSTMHSSVQEVMKNDFFALPGEKKEIDFSAYHISYEELWEKYDIPKDKIIKKYIDFYREQTKSRLPKDKQVVQEWERKNKTVDEIKRKIKEEYQRLVYGENNQTTENKAIDKVFQKYQEIVDQAKKSKKELKEIFKDQVDLSDEDIDNISGQLMEKAKKLLDDYVNSITENSEIDEQETMGKLDKINTNIILLNQIIQQVPREEIAKLDLREIKSIERMENISAHKLLENKDLFEKIKKIIKAQFPDGDDNFFEEEYKNNKNLKLTITIANDEVLSFFSSEKVSEHINYIDWFISNPDSPVKGLGEATLRLGFDENNKNSYYAVAKPHAKSFYILVEKLGFVSFEGSTFDGEYKDHYARVRKFETEKNFVTKKMNESKSLSLLNTIDAICLKENTTESFLYKSKRLKVCKISYHGQSSQDDILETDKDGWLLAEIKKQYEKGYVLTRFIPNNNTKDNQLFYVIFEKDNAKRKDKNEIDQVIDDKLSESNFHSDSKKALSN